MKKPIPADSYRDKRSKRPSPSATGQSLPRADAAAPKAEAPLSPAHLLRLQRTVGNRVTARRIGRRMPAAVQRQDAPEDQPQEEQPDPVAQEWAAHPAIHHHFHDGLQTYRNLRPQYQAEGIQNPAEYLDDNIVSVQFFGRRTPVHQDLRQPLADAAEELADNPPTLTRFWGFVPRLTANGDLSNHALGRAIDIDRHTNPHIRNDGDIRVIEAVTGVNLGAQQDAETMRTASETFQEAFGDAWVQQKRDELQALLDFVGPPSEEQQRERQELEALLALVENAQRRRRLDEYAREGFLNLEQSLIDALTGAGFEWGGEWHTEKDFMHFEIDP